MASNDTEDGNRGNHTRAATSPRLGHRIREIRQQLHHRHHALTRYQVTHTTPYPPAGRPALMSVTSDEYQARLYVKSRNTNPKVRLASIREAIATSPYTWEDLTADGVREWVERSAEDDALVAAAVESLGDLELGERAYLGKFTVERIYEMLTDAEADFWYRALGTRHRGLNP